MCFPVNIVKFWRTPILKNIYKRLPLDIQKTFRMSFERLIYVRFMTSVQEVHIWKHAHHAKTCPDNTWKLVNLEKVCKSNMNLVFWYIKSRTEALLNYLFWLPSLTVFKRIRKISQHSNSIFNLNLQYPESSNDSTDRETRIDSKRDL